MNRCCEWLQRLYEVNDADVLAIFFVVDEKDREPAKH
jgi:hypothetical protein